MLSSCINRVDDEAVRSVISNLTFIGFDWSETFSDYIKVDYSKYRQNSGAVDLELTPEQQLLFYKLETTRNEFIVASKSRQEEMSKSLTLFGINFNEVSAGFKLLYIVSIFAIAILGVLYLLGKVTKKEKEKKKKKEKKSQ